MGFHTIGSCGLSRLFTYFSMITLSGESWSAIIVSCDWIKEPRRLSPPSVGCPRSILFSVYDPPAFHRFLCRKDDESRCSMRSDIVAEKKQILIR
jgi:hypothetical protein